MTLPVTRIRAQYHHRGSMSSRLFQEIREKKGLAYSCIPIFPLILTRECSCLPGVSKEVGARGHQAGYCGTQQVQEQA